MLIWTLSGFSGEHIANNLKLGFQTVYKRFSVSMPSIGIGVCYKNTILYDRINPNDVMITPTGLNAAHESRVEGRYYTASFPSTPGWVGCSEDILQKI